MNADTLARITRSLQKHLIDALAVSLPQAQVFPRGRPWNAKDYDQTAQLGIDRIAWNPGHAQRLGELDVEVYVTCRRTADLHRIEATAGAVMVALERSTIAIYDYPAETPTRVGAIRLHDAEIRPDDPTDGHAHGPGDDVPLMASIISLSGTIELD